MKFYIAVFTAILTAAACSSCSQQIQARHLAQDEQYCRSIGASGPAFTQCMMYKDNQRAEAGREWQQNLNNYNAMLNQQYARPTTTVCNRQAINTVTCNTM